MDDNDWSERDKLVSAKALTEGVLGFISAGLMGIRKLYQQDNYCLPFIEKIANLFSEELINIELSQDRKEKIIIANYSLLMMMGCGIVTSEERQLMEDKVKLSANRIAQNYDARYGYLPPVIEQELLRNYAAIKAISKKRKNK